MDRATPTTQPGNTNQDFVRDHYHRIMADHALERIEDNHHMKVAVCIACYLVLLMLWLPALDLGLKTSYIPTVAQGPVARARPIMIKPAQPARTALRKRGARKVPIPEVLVKDIAPSFHSSSLTHPDVIVTDDWTGTVPEGPPGGSGGGEGVATIGDFGVTPPVFTRKVAPLYPHEAMKVRMQGYVILQAILRKDGRVTDIEVVRHLGEGKLGFEREAQAALKQWTFLPGRFNGLPSDVRMTIQIDFILH